MATFDLVTKSWDYLVGHSVISSSWYYFKLMIMSRRHHIALFSVTEPYSQLFGLFDIATWLLWLSHCHDMAQCNCFVFLDRRTMNHCHDTAQCKCFVSIARIHLVVMILRSTNVLTFSITELHLVVMILCRANTLTVSIAELHLYGHDTAQ